MDSQTYQKRRLLKVFKAVLTSMDFSPCGKYIICSPYENAQIRKFDLVSQKLIHRSDSYHNSWIYQIRYSTDGQLIASANIDNVVIIRNASTLKQLGKIMFVCGRVRSLAFSPDSLHLVSASKDGTISVWDCQSQEQFGPKIASHSRFVQYSPSGLQILSVRNVGIDIWDFTTRKLIMTLTDSDILTAQYSQDGRQIVSGNGDDMIRLWDATTGKQIGSDLVGRSTFMKSVALSPDSSLIVSGGHDKTVRLWNSATGNQVSILHTHAKQVHTVQFSKTGKYILSGSWDGTIVKMKC